MKQSIKLFIALSFFAVTATAFADDRHSSERSGKVSSLAVNANVFFNATGIYAPAGKSFHITARGVVDISNTNGGYRTLADGTIMETPPSDQGAFQFFQWAAGPTNTDPVEDSRKLFLPQVCCNLPGHLPGAPYGALVAGFSPTATPTSFTDFPNGFALINEDGVAIAPSTGGYLFLGVNDFNNTGGDNSGAFRVRIFPN
jgi:hypothetical protein